MSAPYDPALVRLAQQIIALQARLAQMERNQRSAQLPYTSIDNGALTVNDSSGNAALVVGLQPDGTFTTQSVTTAVPQSPSTPIVTAAPIGLLVTWDGFMADGSSPLADFSDVEIHCSQTPGFTPDSTTIQGSLTKSGTYLISGLSAGTVYYITMLAVNQAGNTSAPSVYVPGIPNSVIQPGTITQEALAAGLALAGNLTTNPYFAGGDLTGWAPYNGTMEAVEPPPGNPPNGGGWVAQFTATPGLAGAALEGSPAFFPVNDGIQYMISVWVYAPAVQGILAIGFDWITDGVYTSTDTQVQDGVGDWQQYTAVFTAPDGVNGAYARIGPTDLSGTTIYAWGVVTFQEVPGALIQAGSLTAIQIAAAAITADLIAAGAIDGMTINGAVMNAASIFGDQVVLSGPGDGVFTYGAPPATVKVFDDTSTNVTWTVPDGVTSFDAYVFAAGGGGSAHTAHGGCGGGGGGSVVALANATTPGSTWYAHVGSGGASVPDHTAADGGDGGDSWFNTSNVSGGIRATGGSGGSTTGGSHAPGGGPAGGYSGFSGGTGGTTTSTGGGGGGGGAGSAGNGGSGHSTGNGYGAAGGSSGSGTYPGGSGGHGGGGAPGVSGGNRPGGGGGGSGMNDASAGGGNGRIIIVYSATPSALVASLAGAAGTDPVNASTVPAGYMGPIVAIDPVNGGPESWHTLGSLTGYTVQQGRYRMLANGDVMIEIYVTSGGANAASVNFVNQVATPYIMTRSYVAPVFPAARSSTVALTYEPRFLIYTSSNSTPGSVYVQAPASLASGTYISGVIIYTP